MYTPKLEVFRNEYQIIISNLLIIEQNDISSPDY